MALSFPIPAWLQVSPTDYLSAAQSGLQLGLSAAREYQQANEFNTRLQEAAKENAMDRQAKSETQERAFLVEQQRNMMESEYRHQLIAQNQQKAQQTAEIAKAKAQEGIAHWQEMQKLAALRAKVGRVVGPGAAVIDDEGQVIYERPFKPSASAATDDLSSQALRGATAPASSGPMAWLKSKIGIGNPAATDMAKSPFQEGATIRSKKDGKVYVVKNGQPVPVSEELPADETVDTSEETDSVQ